MQSVWTLATALRSWIVTRSGSGSWLVWVNGTAAHHADIHCWRYHHHTIAPTTSKSFFSFTIWSVLCRQTSKELKTFSHIVNTLQSFIKTCETVLELHERCTNTHSKLQATGSSSSIYRVCPKTGPFLNVCNSYIMMTQKGVSYMKMFNSLLGLRFIFCILLR